MLSRCLIVMFAVVSSSSVFAGFDEKKPVETVDVKLQDLTLRLPKAWSKSDVVNRMRLGTFDIPAVEGDKEKGELAVSTFGGDGGGVEANLKRWIDQFDADGRNVAIRKGTADGNTYHVADISGTYQKPVGPPVLQKKEPMKNARMLGVILEVKGKGVYFLKLTGPDATVKAQTELLRASFGGKLDGESDYEF